LILDTYRISVEVCYAPICGNETHLKGRILWRSNTSDSW